MKKLTLGFALLLGACDLDLFGAFGEYCNEHPGACDGGVAGTGGNGGGAATGGGTSSGGGQGGSGGAGGGIVSTTDGGSLDGWCERYADAVCNRAVQCQQSRSLDCREATMSVCARNQRPLARLGLIRFDAVAADACVARVTAAPCSAPQPVCTDVMLPNAQLGQKCDDLSANCLVGYCPSPPRNTTNGVCPVCTALAALGESCVSRRCDSATGFCDLANDGGTCAPFRAAGAPCTAFECREGCIDYFAYDGGVSRCGPVALGAACGSSADCGAAAYCDGNLFDFLGTRLRFGQCTARRTVGQTCTLQQTDEPCTASACLGGTCTSLPTLRADGAPCTAAAQCQSLQCNRPGFETDGGPLLEEGTCQVRLAAGGACISSFECQSGLHCASDGGCAAALPAGADCSSSFDGCGVRVCVSLDAGLPVCAGVAAAGAPCADQACPNTFRCVALDGGAPTCQRLPVGATCMGPPFCASFRCDTAASMWRCAESCFQ